MWFQKLHQKLYQIDPPINQIMFIGVALYAIIS
jgi:hypothetical protein